MTDRRFYYWAFLKVFTVVGIVVLALVLMNSLFISNKYQTSDSEALKSVELDISGMKKGEIRKSRWDGKEVAVLYRKNPVFHHTKMIAKLSHGSLNSGSRSIKADYFVYINNGDSGNCPLFYSEDTFKDICTGMLFNSSGREKMNLQQGYNIEIPPHYFIDESFVFGTWSK